MLIFKVCNTTKGWTYNGENAKINLAFSGLEDFRFGYRYIFTNSTRLFCALPSAVPLSPTGCVSPLPSVVKRSGEML